MKSSGRRINKGERGSGITAAAAQEEEEEKKEEEVKKIGNSEL